MKSGALFPLLLLAVLGLVTAQCGSAPTTAPPQVCPEIKKGLVFLKGRYNPRLGLLNEAPNAAPHTYWLANDNVLGAYALERLGETELSAKIWEAVRRYNGDANGLIEVVWGKPVTFPPYDIQIELISRVGEDEIKQEWHTRGARLEDWAEYANLGFLGALNAQQQGHTAEAQQIFARSMALFDGTGFRDKAFEGEYETYKVALALYVGAAIQAPIPHADTLRATLRAMQTAAGGFATHYRNLQEISGDANTETTSLALLALMGECP
jgi:hypothetical protein